MDTNDNAKHEMICPVCDKPFTVRNIAEHDACIKKLEAANREWREKS